ncbi:MAG: hypothetical protein HZA34_04540 [Candidatus Pacebacteria bacterium]|nr:hypothetical protein [Candidatus Paceibacterota bacterium]
MPMLTSEVVSSFPKETDITFIRYEDNVGIASGNTTHEALANTDGLFDLKYDGNKLGIHDGGILVVTENNELLLRWYFTSSTQILALLADGLYESSQFDEVRMRVRQESAQRIANITGRIVQMEHNDKSIEKFTPNC